MSTSAHERRCWQSECAARDIANSLFQKWAIKGFFPESPCRWLSLVLSFAPKESTSPFGAEAPPSAPSSSRQAPARAFLTAKLPCAATSRGLSSGQTIGAARTAVRSACCLPELRVISAFGGQPTGLIFSSVPPFTPSVSPTEKKPYAKSHPHAVVGASSPTGVVFYSKVGLPRSLQRGLQNFQT